MILNDVKVLIKNAIKDKSIEFNCYFVGGCVRDFLRNKDPKDIDIVVDSEHGSHKLALILFNYYKNKMTVPFRLGHYPIWSVRFTNNICENGKIFYVKDIVLEIADTMKEEFSNPFSRQRNVVFSSLEDDILRRDFSINSGLINISNGEFVDITKCVKNDIENEIIRCNAGVDKDKIFSDDPLRILRGCVFHARFGWEIEKETANSMIKNGYRLSIISQERITTEINKAFKVKFGAYRLINILNKLDLLKYIFPLIEEQKNVFQWNIDDNNNVICKDSRNIHLEGSTVFKHTLTVLRHTKEGVINGWAALFHDIGKNNKIREQTDDFRVRFIHHEIIGSKIAWKVLHENYKLDHESVKRISFLIKNHMCMHIMSDYSDKTLRKFIRDTESDEIRQQLFDLCNADNAGCLVEYDDGCIDSNLSHCEIQTRILDLIERDKKEVKQELPFNGNEIMEILNLKPSKEVGIAKSILLEIVYEFGYGIDKNKAKELLIERFNNRNENKC